MPACSSAHARVGSGAQDWHQKLHNNTTPDDIAICEAYIAFLEGGGDNGAYWRVLSDAGERPAPCQSAAGTPAHRFCLGQSAS